MTRMSRKAGFIGAIAMLAAVAFGACTAEATPWPTATPTPPPTATPTPTPTPVPEPDFFAATLCASYSQESHEMFRTVGVWIGTLELFADYEDGFSEEIERLRDELLASGSSDSEVEFTMMLFEYFVSGLSSATETYDALLSFCRANDLNPIDIPTDIGMWNQEYGADSS